MNPFRLSEGMVCVFTSQGLVSDHRLSAHSVPLRVFWPESKAHDRSWLGKSGKESWHLLSRLVVWFLRTHGWVVIDVLRWRNWGLVTCLMSSVSWEGLSCSLLPPDSIWLTHRLSSGPGSWDLFCKGLGLPEYLPGALPVVTGAPGSPTCFPGGVVDPVEWHWTWVPWVYIWNVGVVFFFFFFKLWKQFKVE